MTAVYIQGVMCRVVVALALLAAGCGRLGFSRSEPPIDASGGTDTTDDDAPPMGPFGMPAAVPSINTGSGEDDPSLTGDQLEMVFDSDRAGGMGGGDLWSATRATTAAPWGMLRNLTELNTTGDDATPELSRDGLTLYWVANGAAGAKDVWVATRANRTSTWGVKQRIVELSSAADESGPTLTPDELAIYFSRDPSGTDDLYVSTRATTSSTWGTPSAVPVNMAGVADGEPFINGSNTLLLWMSGRTGANDLYSTRRATPSDSWGTAMPISELNTAGAEGDPWLSPDEHVIYFSRGADIYMATR